MEENKKSIYIVLSQSGAMFSKLLKIFTGAEFNHVSISLDSSLKDMYSFARLRPYNPFVSGFVEEGKDKGTFKRFVKTKALVMELKISKEKYDHLKYFIDYMIEHKNEFKYNYLGIIYAIFKKDYSPTKKFYCSQFVRACLDSFEIENVSTLPKIIKPIDFLKLNNTKIIYKGLLKNYSII